MDDYQKLIKLSTSLRWLYLSLIGIAFYIYYNTESITYFSHDWHVVEKLVIISVLGTSIYMLPYFLEIHNNHKIINSLYILKFQDKLQMIIMFLFILLFLFLLKLPVCSFLFSSFYLKYIKLVS